MQMIFHLHIIIIISGTTTELCLFCLYKKGFEPLLITLKSGN